jgi:hypothetical protein
MTPIGARSITARAQTWAPPTSRRCAAAAHGARVLCACGRKAELEDFPYG